MAQTVKARTGGRLVAETLEALGAETAFGVPGIHALAIWEGLRTSSIVAIGLRSELSAGFAADGYARTSGRPRRPHLAGGAHGGGERPRPGGRDRQPNPA